MAWPLSLNASVSETITEHRRNGESILKCAAAAGVTAQSIHSWRQKGAKQPNSAFGDFAKAFAAATIEAKQRQIAELTAAFTNGHVAVSVLPELVLVESV